jgi:hypothetical protein
MQTPLPDRVKHYLDWSDKGSSTFVRYLIGSLIIFPSLLFLGGLVAIPFMLLGMTVFAGTVVGEVINKTSAFLLAFVLVPLVTKFLLKRPWWSFGFPVKEINYWNFGVAVLVSLVVALLSTLLFGAMGLLQIKFQMPDIGQYLLLVVIGIVGFFIQTATEEFAFRGFLTQFVRKYLSHPVLFLGIPALLFAAPHILNISAYAGQWYAILPYLVSGLLFGWFAYRTGSLWMAMGLHFANNLGNAIFIGSDIDILPSLAPVIISKPSLEVVTGVTLFSSLLMFVILEFLIRRKEKQTAAASNAASAAKA